MNLSDGCVSAGREAPSAAGGTRPAGQGGARERRAGQAGFRSKWAKRCEEP